MWKHKPPTYSFSASLRAHLSYRVHGFMNATMLTRENGTSQRGLNGWGPPLRAYSIRRESEVSLLLPNRALSVLGGVIRGGPPDRCSSHRRQYPYVSLMGAVTTSSHTSAGGSGLLLPDAPALYGVLARRELRAEGVRSMEWGEGLVVCSMEHAPSREQGTLFVPRRTVEG